MDGLNSRHLFLIVLETRKFKVKMPADFVLRKALFLTFTWSLFTIFSKGGMSQTLVPLLLPIRTPIPS
jgi:hypothetical protein